MYREAVKDYEMETEPIVTPVPNKTVTITIAIDPDNGTFAVTGIVSTDANPMHSNIWPGDTLVWNFTPGTLDLSKLTVELPRLGPGGTKVTKAATAPFFKTTLPKPFTMGWMQGRDGGRDGKDIPMTTVVGVGHKLTYDGEVLTRPDSRLVIDTSGPPPM